MRVRVSWDILIVFLSNSFQMETMFTLFSRRRLTASRENGIFMTYIDWWKDCTNKPFPWACNPIRQSFFCRSLTEPHLTSVPSSIVERIEFTSTHTRFPSLRSFPYPERFLIPWTPWKLRIAFEEMQYILHTKYPVDHSSSLPLTPLPSLLL